MPLSEKPPTTSLWQIGDVTNQTSEFNFEKTCSKYPFPTFLGFFFFFFFWPFHSKKNFIAT